MTFKKLKGLIPVIFLINFIFLSGCGTSGRNIMSRESRRESRSEYDFTHLSKKRQLICEEAMRWIGTPYKYAMQDKGIGTDCSGMVLSVFNDVLGIKLPRNSAKQAAFCREIDLADIRPGDLLFFATGKDTDKISHVGIAISGNEFVHASSSKGVVVSKLHTPYYDRTFRKCTLMPE